MKKETSKLSSFINTLINILFIPVLILALFSSVLMLTAKKHNEVPSLFGYSSVYILSNSMEPEFMTGSYTLVKSVDTDTLVAGDVIAFYSYYKEKIVGADLMGNDPSQLPASTNSNVPTTILSFLGAGAYNSDQEEAVSKASKVLFHKIVKIHSKTEDDGSVHRYFVTGGINTSANDTYAIKDTMVIGKHVENAGFVANVFKFAGSSSGIVLLVIIPSGIMLLLLSQSIIEQIAKLSQERYANEIQAKKVATFYEQEQSESIRERQQAKEKKVDVESVKEFQNIQKDTPKAPPAPPKAPPAPPKAPPAPPKAPAPPAPTKTPPKE